MPRTIKPPSYRLHKRTGQAVVTLNGRDHYLGPHGTKTSRDEYDRLVGEWLASGRCLPDDQDGLTVSEVLAGYWRHVEEYYQKDGRPTSEVDKIRLAMQPVKRLYGQRPAEEFGPLALKTVRQVFVDAGYGRHYVNDQVGRVKRAFRWAVGEEMIPTSVDHGLQTVNGLRRGRTKAPEGKLVKPVPDEDVDAINPHVSPQVWAIVELQRLTGMRPGEVVIMRGCDLDMSGKLWLYRPESHKTEHHGHDRVVEIGPRAQAVIRPFLKTDLEAYLFSPQDAETERRVALHAKRQTPMSCGNRPGTNRKGKPKRTPRERYDPDSYRRAITRACELAEVPKWHPHQLRHNYATMIRREFGLEAARILLGHRSVTVTEIYAEVDRTKTRAIVEKVG